jgi:hypothetical protein
MKSPNLIKRRRREVCHDLVEIIATLESVAIVLKRTKSEIKKYCGYFGYCEKIWSRMFDNQLPSSLLALLNFWIQYLHKLIAASPE